MPLSCALCDLKLPSNPLIDGERAYCCHGCRAVDQILLARGDEARSDHPLLAEAARAGLISNPELIAQLSDACEGMAIERLDLQVGDMWCPSCAEVIRLSLLKLEGVKSCVVDYATDLCLIEYAPQVVGKEAIKERITRLGYVAEPLRCAPIKRGRYLSLGIAAFSSINLMMLSWPVYANLWRGVSLLPTLAFLSFLFALPVVGVAYPIFQRAFAAARIGLFGMEALVSLAVLSAFALSCWNVWQGSDEIFFDSMAMVVLFVLLGRLLESRAKFSLKNTLLCVTRSLPKKGRCEDGRLIPLKEFKAGDTLLVFTGERVVLDGEVIEGQGACDESAMTGEALPVLKGLGDRVCAGTILKQGSLQIQVRAQTSALERLVEVIERDLAHKKPCMRPVDRVSRIAIPIVIAIALVSGYPLSVLLIACPCAIGIAAPLVESLLLHRLAKLGIIVRNRSVLHKLGKEERVAFDKTGTITEGEFTIHGLPATDRSALKALANRSSHPICVSLAASISEPAEPLDGIEEVAGRGMRGGGYLLGSKRFLEEQGIEANGEGLFFAFEGQLIACMELEDRIREGAQEVIASVAHPSLISGDSEAAVARVAKTLGFSRYEAELNPLEKREWILKHPYTCFVGDGINDAPAMSAAFIGVSLTSAADISFAVSDLSLTNLSDLPAARRLCSRGRRLISQNLFWAFFYNGLGVALAALGYLHPFAAAGAMVLSSLLVMLNSFRISRK